ncbi:tRNA lysidine(34) synthetase TilS [Mycobacterium sp. 155]|uniref:tRNA lysidine(34) synthetase TilS n=1 Tax=Mycobacterium sp. 155 TaxID=1157943 RepID=UPI00036FFABE|nr:tRNA lysidine(34) synthetase TilS [Mycobacterium sp. 155]
MDRSGAVAALRRAVTTAGAQIDGEHWCVALSGGPDSLALTAIAAAQRPTTALVVDHGLQAGSRAVAQTAGDQAVQLGCVGVQILPVEVGRAGGPEAAARTARYAALDTARAGAPVLLGHTLDDQAETVLLGLGRGSGPRSIAGMRPHDPPWHRPLLEVRRALTHAACDELGLTPWQDPHNSDARFTRSRLRHEVMPALQDVLGGGVVEALGRTARALREDCDALDELARHALIDAVTADGGLDITPLMAVPDALRRRVIREWLISGGASGLTDTQIRAANRLVTAWRGQGGVAVSSSLRRQRLIAGRHDGVLRLHVEPV